MPGFEMVIRRIDRRDANHLDIYFDVYEFASNAQMRIRGTTDVRAECRPFLGGRPQQAADQGVHQTHAKASLVATFTERGNCEIAMAEYKDSVMPGIAAIFGAMRYEWT
jgi:hypothetical protein